MNTPQIYAEHGFDLHFLNKYASLMAAGNGYIGIRASHEEDYSEQVRGMFIAGLFHRTTPSDTNELVNLPDIVGMRIEIEGEIFSLQGGERLEYQRELHLANGELCRNLIWRSATGKRYRITSTRRLAAKPLQLHLARLTITPLDGAAKVKVTTGIDASLTNSGRQHLQELSVRVFDQQYLQGHYRTLDGSNEVIIGCCCRVPEQAKSSFVAKNRRLMQNIEAHVDSGSSFTLEKTSWITSSLEADFCPESAAKSALADLASHAELGWDALALDSDRQWQAYWLQRRVLVESQSDQDQVALDFALYHLKAMTPAHDERCSIAAKGLSGEGYKGHVFWDTEIFLLPLHLFTEPGIARQLLRYRYLNLEQARAKASRNGYEGALFPWESAFSGEEETPEYAAINIRTGLRQKVASALAEHHIVADIAFAVVGYYQATGDREFMSHEGIALLQATAEFWMSRAVEVEGRLEIHDVIGPDEYTEHINNNAYTNYLAHYNVRQALEMLAAFDKRNGGFEAQAGDFLKRLYLPIPTAEGVIPQDDSFLGKPTIDLGKYKASQGSQSILLDYARAEVNEMQILKQADVIMLLFLLPELFGAQTESANLDYYEPRTIHDSSLSKAIHAIIASRCQRPDLAYHLYQEACLIDLGPEAHSSDEGIHAAALGAIWLGALFGFAGLSYMAGELHLKPNLPAGWQKLSFPLMWRGQSLHITITGQEIQVTAATGCELTLFVEGEAYRITGSQTIRLH